MFFNILYIIWIKSWRTLRLIQSPCSRTSWNKGNNKKKSFSYSYHTCWGWVEVLNFLVLGKREMIIRKGGCQRNTLHFQLLLRLCAPTASSPHTLFSIIFTTFRLKKMSCSSKRSRGVFSPSIMAPCTKVGLHTHGSKIWEEKVLQAGNAHLVNKTDETQFETPMASASRPRSEETRHTSGLISNPLNILSLWNTRDLILNINAINMGQKCLLWNLLLIF